MAIENDPNMWGQQQDPQEMIQEEGYGEPTDIYGKHKGRLDYKERLQVGTTMGDYRVRLQGGNTSGGKSYTSN